MTWQIDPTHSSATFSVKHMMVSTVRGRFSGVEGTLDFDPARPEEATVEVRIPSASVHTGDPKRDGHLRSPDFFDVENYPEITFRSRKVEAKGDDRYVDSFVVHGDLTIRGTTKPVVLEAELNGIASDPRGSRAGFSASTAIDRKDFGLTWNVALEAGGVLVGDRVKIDLDVAAVRAAKAAA